MGFNPPNAVMSALLQKRTLDRRRGMSALGPIAEVAVIRSVELIVQPDAEDVVGEFGVPGS
jgi:hypothetical protein